MLCDHKFEWSNLFSVFKMTILYYFQGNIDLMKCMVKCDVIYKFGVTLESFGAIFEPFWSQVTYLPAVFDKYDDAHDTCQTTTGGKRQ